MTHETRNTATSADRRYMAGTLRTLTGNVPAVIVVNVYGHTFHRSWECPSVKGRESAHLLSERDATLYFGMLPCERPACRSTAHTFRPDAHGCCAVPGCGLLACDAPHC